MNFEKDTENKIDLKVANFKLLKESNHPAVSIQIGYMTNQEDRLKPQTKEYINELALKITNGIIAGREMMEESN
jgi:N-acetylmuramoyl-L-alanine amidase